MHSDHPRSNLKFLVLASPAAFLPITLVFTVCGYIIFGDDLAIAKSFFAIVAAFLTALTALPMLVFYLTCRKIDLLAVRGLTIFCTTVSFSVNIGLFTGILPIYLMLKTGHPQLLFAVIASICFLLWTIFSLKQALKSHNEMKSSGYFYESNSSYMFDLKNFSKLKKHLSGSSHANFLVQNKIYAVLVLALLPMAPFFFRLNNSDFLGSSAWVAVAAVALPTSLYFAYVGIWHLGSIGLWPVKKYLKTGKPVYETGWPK